MTCMPKLLVLRSDGSNQFNLFIEHVCRSLQNSNRFKVSDLVDKRESGSVIEFKHSDPLFQWEYTRDSVDEYVDIALGIDVSLPGSGGWLYRNPFECHCLIKKSDIVMEVFDWQSKPTTGIDEYNKKYHGGN